MSYPHTITLLCCVVDYLLAMTLTILMNELRSNELSLGNEAPRDRLVVFHSNPNPQIPKDYSVNLIIIIIVFANMWNSLLSYIMNIFLWGRNNIPKYVWHWCVTEVRVVIIAVVIVTVVVIGTLVYCGVWSFCISRNICATDEFWHRKSLSSKWFASSMYQ